MCKSIYRRIYKVDLVIEERREREKKVQNGAANTAACKLRTNALANRFVTFQGHSSIPVVDLGAGRIDNIITQSSVIHMLAECAGLQWFESISADIHLLRYNMDWRVASDGKGHRACVCTSSGRVVSLSKHHSVAEKFVFARPSGKRCFVVSKKDPSYSILDCIFHEADQTYYVIDMVCWRGYPLSDCTAEFRFFWLTSKLAETDAFEPPSHYHKYRFSLVPVFNCDSNGLYAAYSAPVPYVKDGLLFYNKHAHYQAGITPLALVWKDENCSQYVLDTDSKGQVPNQQQVVLELQDDGKLTTSDDPPMVFGCLDGSFIQQSGLHSGCLLRFSIGEGGLVLMDGKLDKADLHYLGKANRARASADSFSKVMFQHSVRHSPLRIDGLLESVSLPVDQESKACDIEMDG
ncbi:hypothetical protein JHK87_010646 [Glycine soja]|nr:hypothetical protein JHK87_010646 [Glycine soja]